MKLKNKKVLVTGADGFIGSHLTEHLVREGNDVSALVLYNSFGSRGWLDDSPKNIQKEIRVHQGDVRDSFSIDKQLEGIEVVFHLAALIAIPYSYAAPSSYVETNVTGTLNVLQACLRHDVEKVVHTSTSEVYGSAQSIPINESHPLSAQSPYAATKTAADQLALAYHRSFDLPVAVTRPFNTYGARQSARAVIPTIITQMVSGHKSIKLGSLITTRDFNFIEDTVNGFVSVAEASESAGQVFNIGSGYEISIGDLLALIAKITGVSLTAEAETTRLRPDKSEVDRLCCDNTKARERLNWTPIYSGLTGLQLGLSKTIDWFSNENNLAKYRSDIFNF